MVRFIIYYKIARLHNRRMIYIPIWLDLLFTFQKDAEKINAIYIPIWLDLL